MIRFNLTKQISHEGCKVQNKVHNLRVTLLTLHLRKWGSGIDTCVKGHICIGSSSHSVNPSDLKAIHDPATDYCSNLIFPFSLSTPNASYFSVSWIYSCNVSYLCKYYSFFCCSVCWTHPSWFNPTAILFLHHLPPWWSTWLDTYVLP